MADEKYNKKTGQSCEEMALIGAIGGLTQKGRQATRDKCSKAGLAAWANLSPEERSAINRERARKAWQTRRSNGKAQA